MAGWKPFGLFASAIIIVALVAGAVTIGREFQRLTSERDRWASETDRLTGDLVRLRSERDRAVRKLNQAKFGLQRARQVAQKASGQIKPLRHRLGVAKVRNGASAVVGYIPILGDFFDAGLTAVDIFDMNKLDQELGDLDKELLALDKDLLALDQDLAGVAIARQ